jgi:hypothetical protein
LSDPACSLPILLYRLDRLDLEELNYHYFLFRLYLVYLYL